MLSLSGLSFLDNVDTSRRDLILIALDPGEVRLPVSPPASTHLSTPKVTENKRMVLTGFL